MTNNTSSENHTKNDDLDLGLMTISNFSSISNNLSLENHVQNDFADIVLTFLGPTICNLSSVICIVGLLTHLKKLHKKTWGVEAKTYEEKEVRKKLPDTIWRVL